jgi:probable phosphoglycerate mutase
VLWLVRHGETDWNRLGIVQGHQDAPELTARGRRQADRAASLLAPEPVQAIFSSDLRRARATAASIAHRVGRTVIIDDRLRERSFGIAEGSPVASIASAVTGLEDDRVVDSSVHPVGGESLEDVFRRCHAFVGWLASSEPTGDVVIVAHGGSLRLLAAALTGSALDGMRWEPVPNGCVRRVVVQSDVLEDLAGAVAGLTQIVTEGGAS